MDVDVDGQVGRDECAVDGRWVVGTCVYVGVRIDVCGLMELARTYVCHSSLTL